MAQPTLEDIFGTLSAVNQDTGNLEISYSALNQMGLYNFNDQYPLTLLAAIIKRANEWLEANQDQAVKATSTYTSSSPSNRNGVDKTEFAFSFSFYGNYQTPTFDPDDLI